MPGGHASHKGSSAKPNTNAEGKIDDATDPLLENPEDLLLEGATTNTTRAQEFVNFPPATERPAPQNQQDDQEP